MSEPAKFLQVKDLDPTFAICPCLTHLAPFLTTAEFAGEMERVTANTSKMLTALVLVILFPFLLYW
jgi:hypothetical protein